MRQGLVTSRLQVILCGWVEFFGSVTLLNHVRGKTKGIGGRSFVYIYIFMFIFISIGRHVNAHGYLCKLGGGL